MLVSYKELCMTLDAVQQGDSLWRLYAVAPSAADLCTLDDRIKLPNGPIPVELFHLFLVKLTIRETICSWSRIANIQVLSFGGDSLGSPVVKSELGV